MEYKFVKYNPSYLLSLKRLLTRSFPIENMDKIGLIQWKYFDPYFENKSFTYVAIDKKNTVVGHYSSMPITVQYGKKLYKATFSTDAATDPNHRGKGIMSRLSEMLYADIKKQGYDFSFGYPNEFGVVMDRHSKNYGYTVVGTFAKYAKFVFARKKATYTITKVEPSDSLEDIVIDTKNHFAIKKDKAYLEWRYLRKPNNEYQLYSISNSTGGVGYVVLRFTRLKCYVYDIITSDIAQIHMRAILRAIENKALERNARLVIYSVLDNKYWQQLFRFPYIKKFYERTHNYLSVHPHDKNINSRIFNKNHWLMMSGDIL